jgi:hypothetical protein
MFSFRHHWLLISILCLPLFLLLGVIASAIPHENPKAALANEYQRRITPSPALWDSIKTEKGRRGFLDDLKSTASEGIGDVLSGLGGIPSYLKSGIPDFFQGFPAADRVQSILGIDDDQIAALPTQVINIPSVTSAARGSMNPLASANNGQWLRELDRPRLEFTFSR